jgi:hypothetical protein
MKICVIRSAHLRKNLLWFETPDEKIERYRYARDRVEGFGFEILAVIIDGRRGVREVFSDLPVQMCHFHQKQIISRYLTTRPKLEASIELKRVVATLCQNNENGFERELEHWYGKWESFVKERTVDPITGRWHYTHKRLRSAYRSLKNNLPYLFTYQRYPKLNIPNTTNSLDGSFTQLKKLIGIHQGLSETIKRKMIDEILSH